MYLISNRVKELFNNGCRQIVKIEMQGVVDSVVFTENDIIQGSLCIDRYSTSGESIELGSAIAAECSLVLDNFDERFSNISFEGAELHVEVGFAPRDEEDTEPYWIECGYFIVCSAQKTYSNINITALDRMILFNAPVDWSGIAFPVRASNLARWIFEKVGVTCDADLSKLPNAAYMCVKPPMEETQNYTYRALLQWVSAILGTCAFFNYRGNIELKWYGDTDIRITPEDRFGGSIAENDITISGVHFENDEVSYASGASVYYIDMSGNLLVGDDIQAMLDEVYAKIGKVPYRPYECSIKSSPYIYPLDRITYVDKKGKEYNTIVTHVNFTLNCNTAIAGKGSSVIEKSYQSSDAFTSQQASVVNHLRDEIVRKITADEADLRYARIKELEVAEATITALEANTVKADSAEFTKMKTAVGEFNEVKSKMIRSDSADFTQMKSDIGEFHEIKSKIVQSDSADFKDMKARVAEIDGLENKYANIDFANISEAAIKKIFGDTGIIKDLIVGDQTITGELVGVTIKGDLIEAETVQADKLVVRGKDGLLYKLNVDAMGTTTEEVPEDKLHGSILVAKSVTAEKVAVEDLVAFGATIGGYQIREHKIYSGAKESVMNTTRGIYMDDEGQFALGDSINYFRYFKDSDGKWKLQIRANEIRMSTSSSTVEEVVNKMEDAVNNMKDRMDSGEFKGKDGETPTLIYVDSSNGDTFKNSNIATNLTVTLICGAERITDSKTMYEIYGNKARIEWRQKMMGETEFTLISANDPRISDNGFIFTISASDIRQKITLDYDFYDE